MDKTINLASALVVLALCAGAFAHSAATVRQADQTVYSEPSLGWQTYCALDPTLVHTAKARAASRQVMIRRVEIEGPHSHDMFSYSSRGELRLLDRQTGEEWEQRRDGGFAKATRIGCPVFTYQGTEFRLVDHESIVACRQDDCTSVGIRAGSYVFAYAAHDGGVVALSNYADALLYRDGNWCRMTRRANDVYECPSEFVEPMVTEPRVVQFYSSILYRDRTLVGEWPTGRLYEFDGFRLAPIENQPPFATTEPQGYEAQALANYCGDLYVGYWPTGDIWKMSHATGEWSLAHSLFPPSDQFYPYSDRPADDRTYRFYGRRVASLVLHGDSMYATTANLNDWPADYESPAMSEEEADLYGATWRITRRGCTTSAH